MIGPFIENEWLIKGILTGTFTIIVMGLKYIWQIRNSILKLEKTTIDISLLLSQIKQTLEIMENQIDIHDDLFSDLAGESINSRRIAKGQEHISTAFKKDSKDC